MSACVVSTMTSAAIHSPYCAISNRVIRKTKRRCARRIRGSSRRTPMASARKQSSYVRKIGRPSATPSTRTICEITGTMNDATIASTTPRSVYFSYAPSDTRRRNRKSPAMTNVTLAAVLIDIVFFHSATVTAQNQTRHEVQRFGLNELISGPTSFNTSRTIVGFSCIEGARSVECFVITK